MISLIIPVWNQGRKARDPFFNIVNVLHNIREEYEIIFIDDGSTDDTFEILKEIHSNYGKVKVIRLERNVGQHQALIAGFELACGDVIIAMDADAKVDPKYIPDLLNKLKEGYDIVVAWRVSRPGLVVIRQWASFLINAYTNFITGHKLHDHACSLKIYRGKLIKENLSRRELRRFLGILIARYANRVSEVKVLCNYKYPRDSSFTFKGLSLLLVNFILSSVNIGYRDRPYSVKEILQ